MPKKKNFPISRSPQELAHSIDLDPSAAVEWEIRYSLSKKIEEGVNKKGLSVTEVAKKAHTSRARVTKILKGDSQGISIDVLLRVLVATGQTMKVTFKKVS